MDGEEGTLEQSTRNWVRSLSETINGKGDSPGLKGKVAVLEDNVKDVKSTLNWARAAFTGAILAPVVVALIEHMVKGG